MFLSKFFLLLLGRPEARTDLPVLMYHHFDDSVTADTVVSGEKFREQMTALKEAGYTAVNLLCIKAEGIGQRRQLGGGPSHAAAAEQAHVLRDCAATPYFLQIPMYTVCLRVL